MRQLRSQDTRLMLFAEQRLSNYLISLTTLTALLSQDSKVWSLLEPRRESEWCAAEQLWRTSRPSGHGRVPQSLPPRCAHTPQRCKHSSALWAPPRSPAPRSWNSREAGEDYSRETRLNKGGRQRVPSRLCARLQVPSCSSVGWATPCGKAAVRHATRAHSFFSTPSCASGIFGGSSIR